MRGKLGERKFELQEYQKVFLKKFQNFKFVTLMVILETFSLLFTFKEIRKL